MPVAAPIASDPAVDGAPLRCVHLIQIDPEL